MDRREFLTGSGGLIALASTSAVTGSQSALEKAHLASATIHRIQADGVNVFYREARPVDRQDARASSVMLFSRRAERIENMTKTNKHFGFLNESMKSVKSGTTRDSALTAAAPQGARADARTGITSFIRGSSNRMITSSGLEWKGVFLEAHKTFPAESHDSIAADHLIALFTGHVSRGETAVSQGRFVPYSYYAGAIHLFPAGPIPACRAFTPSKMIVCALDPVFVREVGGEVDSTATEIRRTMDLRDGSLRDLMTLLAVEADTGGLSGKLYAEHLAQHSRFDCYGFLEERISPGIRILERCQTACFSAFLTE